jgi:hypothetical protein
MYLDTPSSTRNTGYFGFLFPHLAQLQSLLTRLLPKLTRFAFTKYLTPDFRLTWVVTDTTLEQHQIRPTHCAYSSRLFAYSTRLSQSTSPTLTRLRRLLKGYISRTLSRCVSVFISFIFPFLRLLEPIRNLLASSHYSHSWTIFVTEDTYPHFPFIRNSSHHFWSPPRGIFQKSPRIGFSDFTHLLLNTLGLRSNTRSKFKPADTTDRVPLEKNLPLFKPNSQAHIKDSKSEKQ